MTYFVHLTEKPWDYSIQSRKSRAKPCHRARALAKAGFCRACWRCYRNTQAGQSGLRQSFKDHGLGEAAASWVGTGENLPISGEQMQSALGGSALGDLAAKFGMSSADVSGRLSELLPQVVDKLTPAGISRGLI